MMLMSSCAKLAAAPIKCQSFLFLNVAQDSLCIEVDRTYTVLISVSGCSSIIQLG